MGNRGLYLKNGYVMYERLNNPTGKMADFFRQVKVDANFDKVNKLDPEAYCQTLGARLINIGEKEMDKEKRLLKMVSKNDIAPEGYLSYIRSLNELIGLKDKFQDLLTELNSFNNSSKAKQGKQGAPMAFTFLNSYLETAINRWFPKFCDKYSDLLLNDTVTFKRYMEEEIKKKVIPSAIKAAGNQNTKWSEDKTKLWTLVKDFKKLLDPMVYDQFINEIFRRYQLSKSIDSIIEWTKKPVEQKAGTLRQNIFKDTTVGENYRSIAGYIGEYMGAFMASELTKKGIKVDSAVFASNIMAADSVTVFSSEVSIDTAQLLNDATKESVSLSDATDRVNDFMQFLPNDDIMVVFESTKMYSTISDDFSSHGFTGTTRNFHDLEKVPSQFFQNMAPQELAGYFFSTMAGGLFQSQRDEITQQVRDILSSYFAFLMFDDWNTIGNTHDNAVHLFNLDNVYVPLSYFCIAAGEAMQQVGRNYRDFFYVSISNSKNIMFPSPQDTTNYIKEHNTDIFGAWRAQREEAYANAKIQVHFGRTFNQLVSDLLRTYKKN